MNIKFMYNGIKVDGKLYKAWYHKGTYTERSGIPAGTITIYKSDYGRFPKVDGLQIENDSDIMTDYFEKDRIRVTPDNKYYKDAEVALQKVLDRDLKREMMRKLSKA